MSALGPGIAPSTISGWSRLDLPGPASVQVRRTRDGYDHLSCKPRVARDSAGRPRVALTLVLSRMPTLDDASIAPLVTCGSLSLVIAFETPEQDIAALASRLDAPCRKLFVRAGRCSVRDSRAFYAGTDLFGTWVEGTIATSLPPEAALDVLYAFDRRASRLRLVTEIVDGPPIDDLSLDLVLGGILDGLDRNLYLSLLVVNADGTANRVPPLRKNLSGGETALRAAPAAVPLVAMNNRLTSLPFAMTASHVAQPSAAALISGGATSQGIALNAHAHTFIGNDMYVLPLHLDDTQSPTQKYPLVSNVAAHWWPDALDPKAGWYAPTFTLVKPAASDNAANAAFSFVLAKTGSVLGSDGTARTGLTATVRLTVKAAMTPETAAAAVANPDRKLQAVPLQNLSCALQIPYRRAGTSEIQSQRFPGAVSQTGDQITINVALLDDWVRLTYASLAFPAAGGPPLVVVSYAFTSYQYIFDTLQTLHVIGGGLVHQIAKVATVNDLPAQVRGPTLIRQDLKIVSASGSVQFDRESPSIAGRAPATPALSHLAVTPIPPADIQPHLLPATFTPHRTLVTRSVVHEETTDASLPCGSYGNFYLQRNDAGVATAIGCQDSLKLGETALKAFDEVTTLRDPAFRVFRSLQQPGRFMVAPTAYRVGRFGDGSGSKAFRPMIMLYGLLDVDPANNRYALTTTLIPDVSPGALLQLGVRLVALTPSGSTPAIVYPTDPFVAATVGYSWALPAELGTPQAVTVIDAITITLSLPLANAALLTAVLDRSGIQGGATFTLPDGSSINAALNVDSNVVGPPESGPVTVALQGDTVTLTNRTQQAMNVTDLVTSTASGTNQVVAANTTLAPGTTATAKVDPATTRAFANATAVAATSIEELDVFVEDVTSTVTFINQLNFSNHQLTALAVQARLEGSSHVETVNLAEASTADVSFTLPINDYLSHQTMQFALVETRASGAVTTGWRSWDLNKGSVIGITADLL
ncbi:hypothetical protein H8B02_26850 [Bradyrhizobium sp. Pear77]|uniref:hypothetical protein n=1 Tax=Bradyrhizobium altum TaxID=1571202 RepID=UPI001E434CBA|nr:hypothetical protein [Bradyrhizobium altum]MCC8956922.1 hypothetical protein [Bradyrhizobium altum]